MFRPGNAQSDTARIRFGVELFSTIGKNQPVRLTRKYVTDDVGPFHGELSRNAGIKLSGMIAPDFRLGIVAGLSEHRGGFELSPAILPVSKIYKETIRTTFFEVNLRRYFVKYLFVDLGILCDFEFPRETHWIDAQNGLGISVGAGKEFRLSLFEVSVSPVFELHSIAAFNAVENQQRLAVFGMKVSMGTLLGNYPKKTKSETGRINPPAEQKTTK